MSTGGNSRHPRRRGRRPHRLFWRVYGYGLLLLVAVTGSMALTARYVYDIPAWGSNPHLAGYVDAELAPLLDDREQLEQELLRLHGLLGVDVAVYADDGERLASAGAEPPEPRKLAPTAPALSHHGSHQQYVAPLAAGRAYVVARANIERGRGHFALMMAIVLAVLALVSLPLARGIVRPLERITETARALGRGDLAARTDVLRVDEVGELAQAVDEMASRLERLVGSEKEMLANLSHELRTPLARIRVALELAEEDDHGSREHLEGIAVDLAELEELIEQVMVAARLDRASGSNGALPLNIAELDVEERVQNAVRRFEQRHERRPLQVHVEQDLPAVEADGRLVERVLSNLLDNAAKYAPVDTAPITLSVSQTPSGLRFAVRDQGAGVSDADLAQIFEPFFRAPTPSAEHGRAGAPGGVGLGLALCRRIVLAHGGNIEAARADGGGFEVWFVLPTATPSSQRGRAQA